MNQPLALIRGIGLLSPLGDSPGPFAEALWAGRLGVGASAVRPGRFAGEIPGFQPRDYISAKGLAAVSRSAMLATAAVGLLRRSCAPLLDPGAAPSGAASERTGMVVGTDHGHLASKVQFWEEAAREGPSLVSPLLFPNTIINSLGGHAAIVHGLRGPNSTITAGVRSSLEAVRYAIDLLRAGRADRVAAVGSDEVSAALLEGLAARGDSSPFDPAGPRASVPFAADRSGIYPAEAAAAVLLTGAGGPDVAGGSGEAAAGPPALAAVAGSASASAVNRGLPAAVELAFRGALDQAGLSAAEVAWAALSGSGSPSLDAAEAEAARAVLGAGAPAAAVKRSCGEMFGAGGMIAVIAAILSLERGEVPPTPGCDHAGGSLVTGLSPQPRPFAPAGDGGRRAVLVSAVDGDGATAVVVAAPAGRGGQ